MTSILATNGTGVTSATNGASATTITGVTTIAGVTNATTATTVGPVDQLIITSWPLGYRRPFHRLANLSSDDLTRSHPIGDDHYNFRDIGDIGDVIHTSTSMDS
jgi:hypothetical protein